FLASSAFSAASSTTRSWSTVSGCFGGGGNWLTAGFSGVGLGGVTVGGGGTVFGTGLTLTAFGGGLPVGPIRVASMIGPCSFSGAEQVIGFIQDGRCSALKKFSYAEHGSTARKRNPTMPMCRTAESTTAFGVALLSSMGGALAWLVRRAGLAHQADLGHAGLLQVGQHLEHAAVGAALVAADQHV